MRCAARAPQHVWILGKYAPRDPHCKTHFVKARTRMGDPQGYVVRSIPRGCDMRDGCVEVGEVHPNELVVKLLAQKLAA
jgi:hypothetical protein